MWGYGLDLDYDIRILVAARIKAMRRRANKGSRELSRELGYAHGYISQVERFQRELSYHALWKLANIFNTTVEAIVGPPRTREEHEWMLKRVKERADEAQQTGVPAGRRPRGG
jgi:transcriptional regulator with XRE-family HTH domain